MPQINRPVPAQRARHETITEANSPFARLAKSLPGLWICPAGIALLVRRRPWRESPD